MNALYYVQQLDSPEHSWISDGTLLKEQMGTARGFSAVGLYSAFLQTLLSYLMLNLTWTSLVFSWGLRRYFNVYRLDINVEPLHPDRCCGLKRIGDVAMIVNTILFLSGIYISLKVIDKIVVQGFPIWVDIGNPVLLASYAVLAPLMFFLPLTAAHKVMQDEKQRFLMIVASARSAPDPPPRARVLHRPRVRYRQDRGAVHRARAPDTGVAVQLPVAGVVLRHDHRARAADPAAVPGQVPRRSDGGAAEVRASQGRAEGQDPG